MRSYIINHIFMDFVDATGRDFDLSLALSTVEVLE